MNGMGEGVRYRYALPYWVIALIVAYSSVFVLCLGWGIAVFIRVQKNDTKSKKI